MVWLLFFLLADGWGEVLQGRNAGNCHGMFVARSSVFLDTHSGQMLSEGHCEQNSNTRTYQETNIVISSDKTREHNPVS